MFNYYFLEKLPDKGEAKKGTSATTDGGDGADINEKTATGASDNTSDPKVTGYSPGSRVELFGLNRKPELNGAKGSVLVYVPDSERYSVNESDLLSSLLALLVDDVFTSTRA